MSKNNNQTDTMYTEFLPLVQPMAKKNGQQLPVDENVTLPYIPTVIDTVPDLQTQFLSSGGKRVTGQNVRDIYYTMSSPVAYWSRGGVTPWSQKVVDYGGYAKYAQIWTVENDKVLHWISDGDNNVDPKPTKINRGMWNLISEGSVNAAGNYHTYFPQISSEYIGAKDIYAFNRVETPIFKEYSSFNLALGKQDGTLSSGLAWVYEGNGAVKIYGAITIINNLSIALGIQLDLSQQHSVNVDAIANTFTKTPVCKLITVGNVTTLNITQLEAPNFSVDYNVTVNGSLL